MECPGLSGYASVGFDVVKQYLLSLRAIILLAVASGVTLASTVAYLDNATMLRSDHIAAVEIEVDRLATLLALAMREPLWNFAPHQADSIIDAVFVNPDVVSITVIDHKDIVFAEQTRPPPQVDKVASARREVERDGSKVGALTVIMSTAGYLQKLDVAREQYARTAVIIVAGSLFIILLVMHRSFVRPVQHLVAASEKIALGELQTPIRPVFSAELATLARSLESTRQALLNLFAEVEGQNRALADANEHLEQRVEERTRSLEIALATLQRAQDEIIQTEKLASLGRIVAGVAHELNTPIGNALTVATTIGTHLEVLFKEFESGQLRRSTVTTVIQECGKGLPIFIRNISRAAQLISHFKQVAIDQTSDQRRCFNLAEVTAEVLSTLEPTLRSKNCTLQSALEENIQCNSFPGAYGQILTNLVTNAAQHGYVQEQKGVVKVQVRTLPGQLAELCVSDDGLGMEFEVRQRIFDPFFTTKLGAGGSGLGMNIVHGLVTRRLGGTIVVDSQIGQGTTITVRFRLEAPEAPTPQSPD